MNQYRCRIRRPDGSILTIDLQAESFSAAFDLLSERGVEIEGIDLIDSAAGMIAAMQIDLSGSIERLTRVLDAACGEIADRSLRSHLRARIDKLATHKRLGELIREPSTLPIVPLLLQMRAEDARGEPSDEKIFAWLNHSLGQREVGGRSRFPYAYPLILLGLAGIVFIFYAVIVIPMFHPMYEESGIALPQATALLVAASVEMSTHRLRTGIILLLAFSIVVVVFRFGGPWFSSLPLLGRIAKGGSRQLLALTTFTSILAELIPQVPHLSTAVRVANQGCQERSLHRAIDDFANQLEAGPNWRNLSHLGRGVPATIVETLAQVTSPTSQSAMLRRLAEIYSYHRSCRQNLFGTLFPPVAMLTVGAISGAMMILLFLPLAALFGALTS